MRKLLNKLAQQKAEAKAIRDDKSKKVQIRLDASKDVNKISETITNSYAPKPEEL